MLWIALHLPRLPLEALLPAHEAAAGLDRETSPGQPGADRAPATARRSPRGRTVAVVMQDAQRETTAACAVIDGRTLLAVNTAAAHAGLRPGQTRATALALAPQACLLPRDTPREAGFVQTLALALAQLTPQVVPLADGVLLEVSASLRLFGGPRALWRRAGAIAHACGATPCLAMASTPAAAAWLARAHAMGAARRRRSLRPAGTRRLLAGLPLAVVPAAAEHLDTLQRLGCRTLAHLRALPRPGLQRRFGPALLRALDQAFGDLPDPREPMQPPPHFEARLELLHRADSAPALLFAGQRLLQALAGWLSAHWRAAQALQLRLHHEGGRHARPPTLIDVALAEPSRDATHLLAVLRERLQRTALPAPVQALELHVQATVAHAGRIESWLPDPTRQASDTAQLIDRLQARLGPQRVQHLAVREDPRAERASTARPAGEAAPAIAGHFLHAAPGSTTAARRNGTGTTRRPASRAAQDTAHAQGRPDGLADISAAAPAPRPVWLLPEPLALAVQRHRPLDPEHGQPLTLLGGPERVEYGWFDGHLVRRDYHVAEDTTHRRLWIYRERPGRRLDARGSGWFLHGLFG